MASLDTIQTTAQNVVQAINQLATTYLNIQGQRNTADISAATLVSPNAGRVAMLSVTTAGSGAGTIYDTNDASSTVRPIFTIPATLGIIFVNMPVSYGIVVSPGAGQTVAVSWS